MSRFRQNQGHVRVVLAGLLDGHGFLGLASSIGSLLLSLVVLVRLFVILATFPAEKEQNLLRIAGAHATSLRRWWVLVKRSTMRSTRQCLYAER